MELSLHQDSYQLSRIIVRGVETLNQLPDILAYFHLSYSALHILCIDLSFNLPDIHWIYRTMSCTTGCFHTTAHIPQNQ